MQLWLFPNCCFAPRRASHFVFYHADLRDDVNVVVFVLETERSKQLDNILHLVAAVTIFWQSGDEHQLQTKLKKLDPDRLGTMMRGDND